MVTRWDNESLYADWIPLHTQWRRRNCQVRARFSLVDDTPIAEAESREMENISRGPTFGDFVTVRTEASMQDITVARLQSTRVQTPLSPYFKCNVLRERLSVDSQNIPCLRNTKEKGVVDNLSISLVESKEKTWCMGPYAGAVYNLSLQWAHKV